MYLGTERLRFGERLRLEYAIDGPALDALVPSLLLQPLLENSLKYAVSPREQGGAIRIEGRTRGAMLEVSVIDDGPGLRDGAPTNERRGVRYEHYASAWPYSMANITASQSSTAIQDCGSTWRCHSKWHRATVRAATRI